MDLIGDYRIGDKIAEGGMATVYRGEQISLRRTVAIKILAHRLTDNPEIVRRFEAESLIIARLRHPNIIHVIDRGITHGLPYFVMEFVDGQDLAAVIGKAGLPVVQKLDIAVQVCKALAYAHRNGVIHRDIKPENILIDRDGQVFVTDFGIAEMFAAPRAAGNGAGLILGTPGYMSPEQAAGQPNVTAASDIYSLGVILYELFAGRKPSATLRRPSEIDARVPAELDEVILRCIHRDPRARYATAEALRDRLLEILGGAHLQSAQRERVRGSDGGFGAKNVLLDVLRDSRHRTVALYENRALGKLIVTKRIYGRKDGLAEARLLSAHPHPHIAHLYGVSGDARVFIVVTEYLAGGSLRDRLVRPMGWEEAVRIARDVCAALAHAHRLEVVHGNLRPSNVLFSATGEVRVTDFGLVEPDVDPVLAGRYALPGRSRTREVDLHAAGVMLHELLLGTAPRFERGALVEDAGLAQLPPDVRRLVQRFFAPELPERFASGEEAVRAMDRVLGVPESKPAARGARGKRILPWLAVPAALAAAAWWWFGR